MRALRSKPRDLYLVYYSVVVVFFFVSPSLIHAVSLTIIIACVIY